MELTPNATQLSESKMKCNWMMVMLALLMWSPNAWAQSSSEPEPGGVPSLEAEPSPIESPEQEVLEDGDPGAWQRPAPKRKTHVGAVLTQVGVGTLVGVLSWGELMAVAAGWEAVFPNSDFVLSAPAAATGITLSTPITALTIFGIGRAFKVKGSAWSILIGAGSGALLGATYAVLTEDWPVGWILSQVTTIAATTIAFHKMVPRENEPKLSFGFAPTRGGGAATLALRF